MWWKWYMNKKNLISCVFILIVGIYWVVFDSAGQVVTLTILHLNDNDEMNFKKRKS